jgi:hypothetical protein
LLVEDAGPMSPQQAAISNNEKVFPVFAKKLSSADEEVFCTTARRLSTWLNSEKAYYPAARPNVSIALLFLDLINHIACPDRESD